MKKRKVIPGILSALMALSLINVGNLHAVEGPVIPNPSFEKEINKEDMQFYKAERTDEMAHDGKYSIKVGMEKPTNENEVPAWRYTSGKGSVNIVIRNVEPNTTYKVTAWVYNKTNVKMSTGVVDIEGQHTSSPWKLASDIKTAQFQSTDEWRKNEHTITTGPRTNEIYAFAYTEWTGDLNGCGLFYVDDFSIEKIETKDVQAKASINYTVKDENSFPETIPAIQEFEATQGSFRLDVKNQVFSSDKFSMEKTKYLAESMVKKGIIKNYTINEIDDATKGKGIVVAKQPINFKLSGLTQNAKIDAYQIDIEKDKIVLYSDYIEGIQNGTMTLLQAFTQRKMLPAGSVHDYTDQVIRGLQVDSGRRYYSIDWLKEQIEQMAYYKQNKLQLRLKDNEGIRYDSKVAAAMVNEKAGYWTQKEVDELVNYAAKFNIEVIPEIDFPGHAEQDAFYYKDWGLGGSTKALDFSKPEVREYMINVYKEAADFFHAKTIHIGGDEFFQSGYTNEGKKILEQWVRDETGDDKANDHDALKLFFNEAAEELFKKDLKVLVWNDNINDLEGVVPLNKDIIVDFWAGTIYGSIQASKTANAGYQIMSSSSSNYHDLWPQDDKLDRPLPKKLYENFTRYTYSRGFSPDEVLTENLDKALGQMFPIWDDAHGYVPEYILSRTLYPRYAVFSLKTWGADYQNPIDYAEFERLVFTLESPMSDTRDQVKINYNEKDLFVVASTINEALEARMDKMTGYAKENAEDLYADVDEIVKSLADYTTKSWSTFEEALKNAKAVMAYVNSTQEDVDAATHTLKEAFAKLDIVKADKEALYDALNSVNNLKESEYKKAGWQALQETIATINEQLEAGDGNPTQEQVDTATQSLIDAIAALEKKPSKFILQYYIDSVSNAIESDYTAESWVPFAEALAHAQEVNDDDSDDLTSQEISNAANNLYSAYRQLVKIDAPAARMANAQTLKTVVDKTALQAAIDEAETLNPERFVSKTTSTTHLVKELIYRFENLEYLEDGKVTVQYVDKDGKELAKPIVLEDKIGTEYKTTALEIDGYKLVEVPKNANGIFDRKEQVVTYQYELIIHVDSEPETTDKDQSTVKTGDSTNMIVLGTWFVVALGGIVLSIKKKKQNM
jgi:N-acetyl-beta-hexosaminidase